MNTRLAAIVFTLEVLALGGSSPWAADGMPDLTFGPGIAYTGLDAHPMARNAVTIQTDGKIVFAGIDDGANECFVARFDASGTLDGGFGIGGVARTGLHTAGTQASM